MFSSWFWRTLFCLLWTHVSKLHYLLYAVICSKKTFCNFHIVYIYCFKRYQKAFTFFVSRGCMKFPNLIIRIKNHCWIFDSSSFDTSHYSVHLKIKTAVIMLFLQNIVKKQHIYTYNTFINLIYYIVLYIKRCGIRHQKTIFWDKIEP